MNRLPISALCISAVASLFAYLTDQPLFLVVGVPLAIACGWVELQYDDRYAAEQPRTPRDLTPLDEDEALEQRLAAFRKALHG